MPSKKMKKSSLNFLTDNGKNLKHLSIDTQSIGYQELSLEYEESEDQKTLSRTEMLVLDYLQFKAARCIQRRVRGWLNCLGYRRKQMAAIIIQREWRRFYCQRMFFRKVEETLQHSIEAHFYHAAQKIQALWRGWFIRRHIHDHSRLMRLQLMAGKDLLHCVAFKLHHLLRTHQIPGIYSLRNSSALSKVEQLLTSLSFKVCNKHTLQATLQRQHEIEKAKKEHKKSLFGTKIPFAGPDMHNIPEPKCLALYNQKNADLRMTRILQMHEEALYETLKPKSLRKKSEFLKQYPTGLPKSSSFCTDVINSMKKWKIVSENNLTVDSNIFKKPQNVQNFIKEVESKISVLQGNCYCRPEYNKKLEEERRKYHQEKNYNIATIPPTVTNGQRFSEGKMMSKTKRSTVADLLDSSNSKGTNKDIKYIKTPVKKVNITDINQKM